MVAKFLQFMQTDIWRIRLKHHSRPKSFSINLLRIIVLSVRGFDEDKCRLRASALTFYTLLSIVPVIAMMFAIAKGFGLETGVEDQLRENFQDQKEVVEWVIRFSKQLLKETQGGLIAGVGVVLLFWAIIKVLGNIENSFNHVWGIRTGRTWGRRFSDYLSFIMVCPVLLVMSSSITVFITSQVEEATQSVRFLASLSPVIVPMLKLLSFGLTWILFTFIYFFMPNTKVKLSSALIAGLVAGTTFHLVRWLYVASQVGMNHYGAIYGSFAALPLFLIWLQLSWLVVLFGAEISFAYQNVDTYEFEPDCLGVSHSYKHKLALLITHRLVQNFCQGHKPADAPTLSHELDVPIRLVRQILYELEEAGVVTQVNGTPDDEAAYQPARDVETLTIQYVMDRLDERGNTTLPVAESQQLEKLTASLEAFHALVKKSPANIALKNI